jgi:hypothetical protein
MTVAVTVQGICRSVSATWITSLGRPDARSFAMPVPEGARRSGQQIDTRPRGTFAQRASVTWLSSSAIWSPGHRAAERRR